MEIYSLSLTYLIHRIDEIVSYRFNQYLYYSSKKHRFFLLLFCHAQIDFSLIHVLHRTTTTTPCEGTVVGSQHVSLWCCARSCFATQEVPPRIWYGRNFTTRLTAKKQQRPYQISAHPVRRSGRE